MSLVNTLAHNVAPLLHYPITACSSGFQHIHNTELSYARIVHVPNTSEVAIGTEHMIPKTYLLALSPMCTLSCTLCELKITRSFLGPECSLRFAPPNVLHSSSYYHHNYRYNRYPRAALGCTKITKLTGSRPHACICQLHSQSRASYCIFRHW